MTNLSPRPPQLPGANRTKGPTSGAGVRPGRGHVPTWGLSPAGEPRDAGRDRLFVGREDTGSARASAPRLSPRVVRPPRSSRGSELGRCSSAPGGSGQRPREAARHEGEGCQKCDSSPEQHLVGEPYRVYRRLESLSVARSSEPSLLQQVASNSAGGTSPMGSSRRRWLNQSTHSRVAYSTSSIPLGTETQAATLYSRMRPPIRSRRRTSAALRSPSVSDGFPIGVRRSSPRWGLAWL